MFVTFVSSKDKEWISDEIQRLNRLPGKDTMENYVRRRSLRVRMLLIYGIN